MDVAGTNTFLETGSSNLSFFCPSSVLSLTFVKNVSRRPTLFFLGQAKTKKKYEDAVDISFVPSKLVKKIWTPGILMCMAPSATKGLQKKRRTAVNALLPKNRRRCVLFSAFASLVFRVFRCTLPAFVLSCADDATVARIQARNPVRNRMQKEGSSGDNRCCLV